MRPRSGKALLCREKRPKAEWPKRPVPEAFIWARNGIHVCVSYLRIDERRHLGVLVAARQLRRRLPSPHSSLATPHTRAWHKIWHKIWYEIRQERCRTGSALASSSMQTMSRQPARAAHARRAQTRTENMERWLDLSRSRAKWGRIGVVGGNSTCKVQRRHACPAKRYH